MSDFTKLSWIVRSSQSVKVAVVELAVEQAASWQCLQRRSRSAKGSAPPSSGRRSRPRRPASARPLPSSAASAPGSGTSSRSRRSVRVAIFIALAGTAIEVLHQRRAVVLLNEIDDRLRRVCVAEPDRRRPSRAHDDQRAHGRHQSFVAISLLALILHEVVRLEHLADVVVVRATRTSSPRPPMRSAAASAIEDHVDRVVVGAGRSLHEFLQAQGA